MDCAIAQDWAAELRSGRWEQGRGTLRSKGDTFCCLGVLCEMAVKAGVIPAPQPCAIDDCGHTYGEQAASGHAPREVVKWAGMNSGWGSFGEGSSDSLAIWNDNGKTFEELADVIDASWQVL